MRTDEPAIAGRAYQASLKELSWLDRVFNDTEKQMNSVKARFVLYFSPRIIALGKADRELVEYEVTITERFPNYVDLLPADGRNKLFYADRAEIVFPDGQVEVVKGGKKRHALG